ncbi:hypothetical protein, partial [Mycoplasma bradburyae]|uniref:hypothetical protein n=1 Tax=Mycoplasma bradburyae TaxID=2963128 RepID=UPI002340D5FB
MGACGKRSIDQVAFARRGIDQHAAVALCNFRRSQPLTHGAAQGADLALVELHDAAHQSLVRRDHVNQRIGRLVGLGHYALAAEEFAPDIAHGAVVE